jgi:hypothetical protein
MPLLKETQGDSAVRSCPLVINFGDEPTQWFREIAAAVQADPCEISVQFVGGHVPMPHDIISLRNALLGIPSSIRLVTTAQTSLPPLTCAVWLVGDERRIARDSVVWLPDLPEEILRGGAESGLPALENESRGAEGCETDEDPEMADWDDDEEQVIGPSTFCGRQRMERDLRALADVINEWFPSWEFKGACLSFDDLVAWDVVKPEWGFGGRGTRTRRESSRQNVSQAGAFREDAFRGDKSAPEAGAKLPEQAEEGVKSEAGESPTKPPERESAAKSSGS